MDEMQVMTLVVNSGNARSLVIEAYRAAREGDCEKADELLKEADQVLLGAHDIQTKLIQDELNGNKTEIGMLVIHSQDHLMCAMTILDLVREMVEDFRTRK